MKPLCLCLPLVLLGAACWLATGQLSAPSLIRHENGEVLLTADAPAGKFYRIEASSDLRNWRALSTVRAAGQGQYLDSSAPGQPQRFYRAVELEGSDVLTGDHLPTNNGDAILRPIGHAAVLVKWNGKVFYSDASGNSPLFTGLPKADVAVVTHAHSDHFSASILSSILGPEGALFVPQSVFSALPSSLREKAKVLANGASGSAHGIDVQAVAMYNMSNSNHPKGAGNGYVVNFGGKRVYFSGDTEDIPEMRALRDIDVAFLCMSLPSNMTVDAAASAVREFRPKVVTPYHYRQGSTTFDIARFKRLVGQDAGVEVRLRTFY